VEKLCAGSADMTADMFLCTNAAVILAHSLGQSHLGERRVNRVTTEERGVTLGIRNSKSGGMNCRRGNVLAGFIRDRLFRRGGADSE